MCRLFLIAALLAAPLASAQKPDKPVQFKVSVDLVYLTVTARDARTNQFVTDLTVDDFAIYDNGQKEDILFFSPERLPVRIVLLMDMSLSMDPRLMAARDAGLVIVRQLRGQDQAKVVMFHNHMLIIQDFTSDKNLLEAAVDNMPDGYETALYDSLYVTLRELEALERSGGHTHRNAIIVLTDGIDTKSLHTGDEILEEARASDVTIYSVVAPPPPRADPREKRNKTSQEETAEYYLFKLSHDTGGHMYTPESVEKFSEAYSNIAEEISVQYSLGYQPRAVPVDDSFRIISVLTPGRENTVLRHRKGYRGRP